MVGDWVLLWGDKPARVDCIGNVEVYLSEPMGQHELDWKVTYEHIKPIPLTPEILGKNGFVKEYVFGSLHHLTLNDEDNGANIGYYPKDTHRSYSYLCLDKEYMSITEMPILYVHELQHALRLCGIDKEIVL